MIVTVKARPAVAAVAVVAVLAGGCASAGHPARSGHSVTAAPTPAPKPSAAEPTARFAAMGLSFRYPAAWQVGTWNDASSFTALIVTLSTVRQHNPCKVTVTSAETSVVCGEPVGVLLPGTMVVKWSEEGFPSWRPPVANTTIGGRPASETHAMAAWCAPLHGTQAITVVIPLGGAWYEMDACLRAPGLGRPQAEIAAMLKSVRLTRVA
jgi:hypothetical protein